MQIRILFRDSLRAAMISPLVRFFIGSNQVEFESILWSIIWYLLPWIEVCGNLSVWLVKKVRHMSFIVMLMLCCFCLLLMTPPFPSVYAVAGTRGGLVERTPWR